MLPDDSSLPFKLEKGTILDGYCLIRPIGRGGFGEVWLCQLTATSEFKALKFLPSENAAQLSRELEALIRYRTAADALRCPNLLPVEHVNRIATGLFYTMPLADGLQDANPQNPLWTPATLAALIQRQKLASLWFDADKILKIFLPLLDAVQQLSDAGIIHRDIKPENILFVQGRPCLGDISLLSDDAQTLTQRGTPGYAAPSWYLESGGNPDLWGLATTLYTLVTGNSPDKLGRGRFLYPPQGESSLNRKEWERFHQVILRATHENFVERFLRIDAMGEALRPRKRKPSVYKTRPLVPWEAIGTLFEGLAASWKIIGVLCLLGLLHFGTRNTHLFTPSGNTLAQETPAITPAAPLPKVSSPSPTLPATSPEFDQKLSAAIADFDATYNEFCKIVPPQTVQPAFDFDAESLEKLDALFRLFQRSLKKLGQSDEPSLAEFSRIIGDANGILDRTVKRRTQNLSEQNLILIAKTGVQKFNSLPALVSTPEEERKVIHSESELLPKAKTLEKALSDIQRFPGMEKQKRDAIILSTHVIPLRIKPSIPAASSKKFGDIEKMANAVCLKIQSLYDQQTKPYEKVAIAAWVYSAPSELQRERLAESNKLIASLASRFNKPDTEQHPQSSPATTRFDTLYNEAIALIPPTSHQENQDAWIKLQTNLSILQITPSGNFIPAIATPRNIASEMENMVPFYGPQMREYWIAITKLRDYDNKLSLAIEDADLLPAEREAAFKKLVAFKSQIRPLLQNKEPALKRLCVLHAKWFSDSTLPNHAEIEKFYVSINHIERILQNEFGQLKNSKIPLELE